MKRIVTMMFVGMLWTGVVFAGAQWEAVNDKGYMVDVNSIKVIQVDYNEIVKATTKQATPDGGYGVYTLMINRDTKEQCMAVMEFYSAKGVLETTYTLNPKNPKNWDSGNRENIEAILNRVP